MPVILTEKQLCEYLQVTQPYLLSLRKKGLPIIPLGKRHIRYDIDVVLEWLKSNGKERTKNV